jgi:hypothetical protein
MNPVHTTLSYFSKIYFNVILSTLSYADKMQRNQLPKLLKNYEPHEAKYRQKPLESPMGEKG